ncbi:MAG TPA: isochorismatase family protein [Pseudonocardiaceae bacterium]|nr:isochorismatase family protein [Pseudonocardiaceae bacterium]
MNGGRHLLDEDYRRAGFGGRLGAGGSPAVLVVDAVRAYLRPESPLYAGVEQPVGHCVELAAAARAAGVPVLLTRVEFEPDGRDGGLFFRKVAALRAFVTGSPDGAFADGLRAEGDIVVTKQYASAFFGTSLASTLVALRVDTLLVCGLTTSGCVRASAMDALNHGFRPLVVAEAVGDRDSAVHRANLFDLDQKYADVLSMRDASAVLSSSLRTAS